MRFLRYFIVVVSLVFVWSCNKQEQSYEETVIQEQAFNQLESDLLAYSTDFGIPEGTKAGGLFWRRFAMTVGADLGGAAVGSVLGFLGAIFGAIFSSAYSVIGYSAEAAPSSVVNNLYHDEYNLSSADSVGYLHNKIIYDIYNEDPDKFENYTADELYEVTYRHVEKYYTIGNSIDKNEIIDNSKAVVSIAESSVDSDEMFAELKKIAPGKDSELEIVQLYFDNISIIQDDTDLLKEYSEGFTDIVKAADISDGAKDVIVSTIGVAGNSAMLWCRPSAVTLVD